MPMILQTMIANQLKTHVDPVGHFMLNHSSICLGAGGHTMLASPCGAIGHHGGPPVKWPASRIGWSLRDARSAIISSRDAAGKLLSGVETYS